MKLLQPWNVQPPRQLFGAIAWYRFRVTSDADIDRSQLRVDKHRKSWVVTHFRPPWSLLYLR
jgi:hypothetical protein